jgi:hypothetical protein
MFFDTIEKCLCRYYQCEDKFKNIHIAFYDRSIKLLMFDNHKEFQSVFKVLKVVLLLFSIGEKR